MNDLIPIITAIIALIGTLAGVVVGYYKWKQKQEFDQFADYRRDRQNTYKQLWEMIENVNVKLRVDDIRSDEFSSHVQEINSFMLQKGIYLDEEDQKLVNTYVQSMRDLQEIVNESGSVEAKRDFGDTRSIDPATVEAARQIGEAQEKMSKLRNEIITKIKKVLGGS